MTEPSGGGGTPQVGRTTADAVVDIARMLGGLVPILLVVAGVVFAFYKFQELGQASQNKVQQAMESTRAQNENERNAASKALRETYEQMGRLSEQQIKNVNSLLHLHDEVATNTEKQRGQLRKVEDDAAKLMKQSEDAKTARDVAQKQIGETLGKRDEVEREMTALNQRLAALRVESRNLDERLRKEQAKVSGRVEDIDKLREQLEKLAKAVLEDSADQGRSLAQTVLAEYRNPLRYLSAFAQQPAAPAAINDLKKLVGLRAEEFEALLKNNSSGFESWLKGTSKDAFNAYIGIVRHREASIDGMIAVSISTGKGTDAGKVTDVDVGKYVVAVAAHDTRDFSARKVYGFTDDGDSIVADFNAGGWTLGMLFAADDVRLTPVVGQDKVHRYLSPDQFKSQYKDAYDKTLLRTDKPAALALQMEERFKDFDVSRAGGNLGAIPSGLRESFMSTVNAVVKSEGRAAREWVSDEVPAEVVGRVAAIALRPSFQVIGGAVDALAAQAQVPSSAKTARVTAQVRAAGGTGLERVTLRFSERGGRWVLSGLETAPLPAPSPTPK